MKSIGKSKLFIPLILALALIFTQCVTRKEGQTQKLGEFIVKLAANITIEEIVEDYKEYECKNKQEISKTMNMYLISYNEIIIGQDEFRGKLNADPKVETVELNTKVSNRD